MKNIVILFIYDGSAEVDWILPVIYKLKKNYKIYTHFQSHKSFNNLKSNIDLFYLWKKTTNKYYIQKSVDSFFWKIFYKVVKILKVQNISLNEFLISKIHNVKKLENKLKKVFKNNHLKVKFIFSSYSRKSGWALNYKSTFKDSKLIHYVDSTWNYSLKKKYLKKNNMHKIILKGDILLLANKEMIPYVKNSINEKKIIVCGTPKYDLFWKKKLSKILYENLDFKYDLIKKKYIIIFAYTSFFDIYKNINSKIATQLFDIMSTILKIKNTILIFKIHPRANSEIFLETLNKFDKSRWIISKNHILNLSLISNCFLHTPLTSTISDALSQGLPTIETWYSSSQIYKKEKIFFKDEGFTNKVRNKNQLGIFLRKLINGANQNLINKKNIKFKKIYRLNSNSVNFIIKKIEMCRLNN